ncbi:hypothetical protein [Actinomadura oligospora]|uniref:hypothetical protein n=1 Tax=Actinomadura oligospora TaxID=111804 RepID=UPI0004B999F6|nr:hypothetical protein [Actinomadura oligospora]
MSDNEALLRRIEGDRDLADLLTWPGDFDIERRDPVEDLFLASGTSLTPIAGDGAGGSFFLCGGVDGPVLYADSEGGASLIAADLTEAVTLIAVLPYWRDLGYGWTVEESENDLLEDQPDFPEHRAELLVLLDITPPPNERLIERFRTAVRRTVPDFQPKTRHDDPAGPYEATYAPLFDKL